MFCERRKQIDGTQHTPWLHHLNPENDEKRIVDFITYEGMLANDDRVWAVGTVRNKLAAI